MTQVEPKEILTYSSVRFVYFDVGGVLLNFTEGLHNISNIVGLPYEDCKKIWLEMDDSICRGEMPPQKLWERIKNISGYKGNDIDFVNFWVDHSQPIPETHKVVQDLSQTHRIGLLSNIYPGVYQLALKKTKIPNIPYASVIQSCEVGVVKPDLSIYILAQKIINVRSEEILFIDDNFNFILPAINLGWRTFTFDGGNVAKSVANLRRALGL